MKPDKEKQKTESELRKVAKDSGDFLFAYEMVEYLDKYDENTRVKEEKARAKEQSGATWAAIGILVALPLILIRVLD